MMPRCVFLGNGPSLNNIDFELLKHEITFGFNDITKYLDRHVPSYWCFTDYQVAEIFGDEMRELSSSGVKILTTKSMISRFSFDEVAEEFINRNVADWNPKKYNNHRKNKPPSPAGNVAGHAFRHAWEVGYRGFLMAGFDLKHSRPLMKDHYCKEYGQKQVDDGFRSFSLKPQMEDNKWFDGWTRVKEYCFQHGGEIYDISRSPLGVFEHKEGWCKNSE